MHLSISCWWSLRNFWYFGTIVINQVQFGAAAFTIKDHMFPIKLQMIRIMCPIRKVKSPPLPKTYFHQVETLFSLGRPVFFPHLGFPSPTIRSTSVPHSRSSHSIFQVCSILTFLIRPDNIFELHWPLVFGALISVKSPQICHKFLECRFLYLTSTLPQ